MLRGNKTVLGTVVIISTTILLFSFVKVQFPPRLQKKVDSAIKTTYAIEAYNLDPIKVSDRINRDTKAELGGDNLFKVHSAKEFVGYIYVGEAPSMKKVFDYVILFNPDLTIKKSKVLIYREDYGLQIGSQRWLKQFIGLSIMDSVVYEETIDGIAGATISANSMTRATDNVLKTLKVLKENELL
ncbi:FMN-binding protein [Saonia flava]|nr:FMN-binding protein [Saonia flava]